jgi:CBS domain-containing protein
MTTSLADLRARDAMVRAVTIAARAPLADAAERLWHTATDALVVVADDGAVVGLLGERDLVLGAAAEAEGFRGTVADHACLRFAEAAPDERLLRVLERMEDRDLRRAVVVERGEPVGVISLPAPARLPREPHQSARA